MSKKYDVFLSYSGKDQESIEKIARRLRARERFSIYFDLWEAIPGERFQQALSEAMDNSATCAVFIGTDEVSPWEEAEVNKALRRQIGKSKENFRVIPVLLPGASKKKLPAFLDGNTWVEFSNGLDDDETLYRLACGIRGETPGSYAPPVPLMAQSQPVQPVTPPVPPQISFKDRVQRTLQSFAYARREQRLVLIALILAVLPFIITFFEESQALKLISPFIWVMYPLAGLVLLYAAGRLWRQSRPLAFEPSLPKPSAIKGPMSFGLQDGALFSQLGRASEINKLVEWIQAEQIPFIVVMGESGAGKSSLLRAGLEYTLKQHQADSGVLPVYWEAFPQDPMATLLATIQEKWTGSTPPTSLDELIERKDMRVAILLDQAEQLSPEEHPEFFAFLRRVLTQKPPYPPITWIMAFRREYLATWTDFTLTIPGCHPNMLSVKRFKTDEARQIIDLLVTASDIQRPEASVVREILEAITQTDDTVSPVDIGISLLVLSELGKSRYVDEEVYRNAGKAEGLLATYIENHLKQLPEYAHQPLLQGLLHLVDLDTDQRVAEGRTPAELAKHAGLPEPQIASHLAHLATPAVRLLEQRPPAPAPPERYRLTHERIIPALRRLTGRILAAAEQARLVMERRYRVWQRDKKPRDLLQGNELGTVRRYREQFHWGADAAQKQHFLKKSLRRRSQRYAVASTFFVLFVVGGMWLNHFLRIQEYRSDLSDMGLPAHLYDSQVLIDSLVIDGRPLMHTKWLKGPFKYLDIPVNVTNLENLLLPDSVRFLLLDLTKSNRSNLTGFVFPQNIDSLLLRTPSRFNSVDGIVFPTNSRTLTLDLSSNQLKAFDGIEWPEQLNTLYLYLSGNQLQAFDGIQWPEQLNTLNLYLRSNQLQAFDGIQWPEQLNTLNLYLSNNQLQAFDGIQWPEQLNTLNLDLSSNQLKGSRRRLGVQL